MFGKDLQIKVVNRIEEALNLYKFTGDDNVELKEPLSLLEAFNPNLMSASNPLLTHLKDCVDDCDLNSEEVELIKVLWDVRIILKQTLED